MGDIKCPSILIFKHEHALQLIISSKDMMVTIKVTIIKRIMLYEHSAKQTLLLLFY